ncbi:NrfD/PsrC family molybdoenzyme membrane anchor subunit [Chloroflexota bacterium]
MIQARPYEFMVRYTPQREWVIGRGIIFWLAFFFIELGAGTFIAASIFSSLAGMFAGWLICAVLGGGLHLLYLGHPLRFWRIVLSQGWKTSWISRGLYFVGFFLILGLIHMILVQWASPVPALLIAADVFAFLALIYVGFVMCSVNGIPLWNTPLLPVLYVVLGIWGGLGVTLMSMLTTGLPMANVELWLDIFLLAFIFIVFIYLFSIRYQGMTGKVSVKQIVAGKWAPLFWIMVVTLGIALPLTVALGTWLAGLAIPAAFLFVVILFELLGDLSLRYCLLRCGLYSPLLPSDAGKEHG